MTKDCKVLQSPTSTRYYKILHSTTKYYTILESTTRYYAILQTCTECYKELHGTYKINTQCYEVHPVLHCTTEYYIPYHTVVQNFFPHYQVPLSSKQSDKVLRRNNNTPYYSVSLWHYEVRLRTTKYQHCRTRPWRIFQGYDTFSRDWFL